MRRSDVRVLLAKSLEFVKPGQSDARADDHRMRDDIVGKACDANWLRYAQFYAEICRVDAKSHRRGACNTVPDHD